MEDVGTHILTWPAGNGALVDKIAARIPVKPTLGAVVRAIEPGSPARLWVEQGGAVHGLTADHVIVAVPTRVADRLVQRPPRSLTVDLAPWRVSQLFVDKLPAADGVPWAWDSVIYGGKGLGYVINTHQGGAYGGGAVLTFYDPVSPDDAAAGRHQLLAASWESEVDAVLTALTPAHPGLRGVLRRLDVLHWGHGTAIPAVGLHDGDALVAAATPLEGVHFAHSDLSGMSLFEEASWHGIRAAEEVLDARGGVTDERLARPLEARA